MISLGSSRWTSSNPGITLSFEYEKQRSGADMQYRTKITISTVSGSSYFGYPIYMKLTIGGTLRETKTLKEANPSQWSNAITYTSPWYTVSNKTTGTTPVSFNVYSGQGSSRSATYSYNMGVDPAASAISAPNGMLGTRLTLTLTRHNDNFTDTITYKCGTATGTVVSGSKAASVYWDTTNGNTVALAAQNTSGKSVTVTFTIATYSGSTLVGTRTDLAIMAIPDSVKPSVSLNVTDAAGYQSIYGAYVQGYSKLNITTTPTLAYGAAIKTYAITADGNSYSTSSVTTDPLKGKDKLTVTARVTDTRTRTSEPASKEITVLAYAKPVVTVSAYRCNSSGTADAEGAYMKIKVASTISSLNGKNSATYHVVYPGGEASGSGVSYTSDILPCDVSTTHYIEVTVTDKLDYTTKAAVVPIAFTLTDYYATGKGISFGKVATRDGFDCAMDAYFGDKRVQEVGSPVADTDAVNRGYAHATFLPATEDDAHPGCYYRMVGDAKEWFNPPMKVDVEYRTVERYMGKPVYVLMKDLGALPNAGSRTVENLATKVDRIVDAVFNTATEGATYHNAQEVSWYVGSYGWPYCIMKTTIDMSAYSARIKLKYTKTTDS